MPLFVANVERCQQRLFEASMNGPTPDVPIQDVFALYRRMKMLMEMYAAFCSSCVASIVSVLVLDHNDPEHQRSNRVQDRVILRTIRASMAHQY